MGRNERAHAARAASLLGAVDAGLGEAISLSRWMASNPELSLAEFETSRRYIGYLRRHRFEVVQGAAGLETAFIATRGSSEAKLRVAFLAEMDALPDLGHACGHNLSGPASLLAAVALASEVEPEELALVVVGCPAEETGAGKGRLVESGVFADVDAALMAHASDMRRAHRLFLGNRKLEFTFHGRAAHAAAYPERGLNALDAVILLFNGVSLLRQQLSASVKVHGIISEGGRAPNLIPERAQALFWIRALEDAILEDAAERVEACAAGAAAATGTRLEQRALESSSPPMRPNLPLAGAYRRQLEFLGLRETPHEADRCIGSSDISHVSQLVPTIHPNFPIGSDLQLHTREFAAAAASPEGEKGLAEAARALALTVLELTLDPDLRAAVAAEG
jgi:amidohydrolase